MMPVAEEKPPNLSSHHGVRHSTQVLLEPRSLSQLETQNNQSDERWEAVAKRVAALNEKAIAFKRGKNEEPDKARRCLCQALEIIKEYKNS